MAKAFKAEGADLEYHLLPPFGEDGHFLLDHKSGVQLWSPIVSEFLNKHAQGRVP